MNFNLIPQSNILLGSYPQSPSDVDKLSEQGVTAVINVQTDNDIQQLSIPWDAIKNRYDQLSITLIRIPTIDFSMESLSSNIHDAVTQLHRLIQQGHTVYIHCTAGMNRSPSIVVAYLAWTQNMTVNQAVENVQKHRHVADPYISIIEQALKKNLSLD